MQDRCRTVGTLESRNSSLLGTLAFWELSEPSCVCRHLVFNDSALMAISLFLMQAAMPFLTKAARRWRKPFSVHDIFYSGVCLLFSFSLSVHLFVSVSLSPNPRLQQGVLAVYYLIQQCLSVSSSSEELHLVTRVQCCSLAVGAGRLIIT